MHGNQLVEILKTFTKKEFKRFDEFVKSPFFNKHQDTLKFWQILRKYAPEFSHKNLEKERLFTRLYGKQPFNAQWLYDLSSYLTRLAEQFLAVEHFRLHEFGYEQHKLAAFAEKRLDTQWDKQYARLAGQTNKHKNKAADFWLEKYYLAKLNCYHHDDYAHRKGFKKFDTTAHQQAFADLTSLYVIDALANQSYLLSHHLSGGLPFNPAFLQTQTAPLFAFMQPADAFAARTFHQSLLLALNGTDEQFSELIQAVEQPGFAAVPTRMQRSILTNMGNYCHKNLQHNEALYRGYLQVVYNHFIELGLLLVNGYFLATPFVNIVHNALQLGSYEWALHFMETHAAQLNPAIRQSLVCFCYAHYYFELQNFEDALVQLHQSNVFWSQNKASHKNLLVRIYYERGETDALLSQIDALKHYLKEAGQISAWQIADNREFTNFVLQLLRFKYGGKSRKLLPALITKIEQSNSIHKKWLLQKASELSSG